MSMTRHRQRIRKAEERRTVYERWPGPWKRISDIAPPDARHGRP